MKKISLMKKILLTLLLIAAGAELAAQTGRNPNPLRVGMTCTMIPSHQVRMKLFGGIMIIVIPEKGWLTIGPYYPKWNMPSCTLPIPPSQ